MDLPLSGMEGQRERKMIVAACSPCAACKHLRRRCTLDCPFALYFPPEQPEKFINVHKVFGAANVAKLLNEIHPSNRQAAVRSLHYEAEARLSDPIYGCVRLISMLRQELMMIRLQLQSSKSELSSYVDHTVVVLLGHQIDSGGGGPTRAAMQTSFSLSSHPSQGQAMVYNQQEELMKIRLQLESAKGELSSDVGPTALAPLGHHVNPVLRSGVPSGAVMQTGFGLSPHPSQVHAMGYNHQQRQLFEPNQSAMIVVEREQQEMMSGLKTESGPSVEASAAHLLDHDVSRSYYN